MWRRDQKWRSDHGDLSPRFLDIVEFLEPSAIEMVVLESILDHLFLPNSMKNADRRGALSESRSC